MKNGISALALHVAAFGLLAPAAFAQDRGNQFERNRYTAVVDRAQPEFDPIPKNLGGFELLSHVEVAARYNDNIFATVSDETKDTFINLRPTAELRSKWSVHALAAGVTVDHKEYLSEDSETVTDYNGFVNGRLDVTRDFYFNGQVFGGRYSEARYAPSSIGNAAEPNRYDRFGFDAGASYYRDRIQLEVRAGLTEDDFGSTPLVQPPAPAPALPDASQDFRDLEETFFFGRASFALAPSLAVFVQGRTAELDYKNASDRNATRNTIQVGANFEFSAPFRGDIAVGQVDDDKDTGVDTDGIAVNARLFWFPTEITTVTLTGNRDVYDPGLLGSSTAYNTVFGARIDHELRRNILLFGNVYSGNREYKDSVPSREDDYLDAGVGLAYRLNRNFRLEAAYTLHSQKEDYATPAGAPDLDRDFDQNIISFGLKFYP